MPSSGGTAQAGSIPRVVVVKRVPCKEKGRSLDSRRPFSLQGALLTTSTLGIDPACAYHPKKARGLRTVSRSIMRVQPNPEYAQYPLLLGRLAGPQYIGVLGVCPCLSYTSPAECPRLRASMRHNSVQHRTGWSFGKGAPAHRASPRRPRAGRRPAVTRRRADLAAGRRRRRPLIFYAVTASVAGELVAIVVDVEALVLLFSLAG